MGQPAGHRGRPDHPPRAARDPRPRIRIDHRSPEVQHEALRPRSSRGVCFDADAGYVTTDVYWRPDLRAGDTFSGPAIVEEFGSTVPVHPGFTVRVDAFGNLVITKEAP